MLEDLRKHSKSWLSKIIFGTIALIFALYFGFSFNPGGAPGGPAAPIAKVNGQTVPYGAFTQLVEKQTSAYASGTGVQLDSETVKVIESQALQALIAKTLFAEAAHSLGLRVPNEELEQEIRSTSWLQKDGTFDSTYYLNQFLTNFSRLNGENFEDALRKDLLVEKLSKALESASIISLKQVETQAKLKANQLNVRKLTLAMSSPDGKDQRETALQLAKDWIASGKAPESQPSDGPKSVLEETGLKSLAELQFLFGNQDSLPVMLCLLELEVGKKCAQPFQVGETVVAVELLDKKSERPAVKPEDPLIKQMENARKFQILEAVQNMLTKQAKIETFLTKK